MNTDRLLIDPCYLWPGFSDEVELAWTGVVSAFGGTDRDYTAAERECSAPENAVLVSRRQTIIFVELRLRPRLCRPDKY